LLSSNALDRKLIWAKLPKYWPSDWVNVLSRNTVGPARSTKISSATAIPMFKRLRYRMPFEMPVAAEIMNATVRTAMIIT
jgi:hypothetical protein